MSDNFIPLNQSTPVHGRWQTHSDSDQRSQNQYHNRSRNQSGPRRGFNNRWGNNSTRNTSHGSESNSSCGRVRVRERGAGGGGGAGDIDAYLHPAMLRDPWEQLRRQLADIK